MKKQSTHRKFLLQLIMLRILYSAPNGQMPNSQIIELGERSGMLTRIELSSVPSRADTRFANFVNNIVSHRGSQKNLIRNGQVEWIPSANSLGITEKGRSAFARACGICSVNDRIDLQIVDGKLRRLKSLSE